MNRNTPLLVQQSVLWKRKGAESILVQVCHFRDAHSNRELKGLYSRERFALSHLSGLAIPAVRRLPAKLRERILGAKRGAVLARTYVEGAPLTQIHLSFAERVGIVLFLSEQLAAIRFRQIVITSIHRDAVIFDRNRLSCSMIDLAAVTVESPVDRYDNDQRVRSMYVLQAPEMGVAQSVTESAFVYAFGMFALSVLIDGSSNFNRTEALLEAQRLLTQKGASPMATWLRNTVAPDPANRLQGFRDAFRVIERSLPRLPPAAVDIYRALRAPYEQAFKFR